MTHPLDVNQLIEQLNKAPVSFNLVIQVIENSYLFTPTEFKNGSAINAANTNNGSSKIFAFGLLNQLSQQATLHAFGDFYTVDVLQNPDGNDHQNIRNFMQFGWQGIEFMGEALTLKS
jgi:hypothetical protein